jgi:hypothetical protein
MKHAGPDVIAQLEPLLVQLRDYSELNEKRPGVFYLKSRAFLHFHEDAKGLFADVKLTDDFARFPVSTEKQQRMLIDRIGRLLSKR